MTTKSALIGATAIAIALTSFDLRPAAAAPQGSPAIAKQNASADEISAARKRRYRGNPAVPLAAFGAIVGTIGAVAAANNRRAYYDGYYHAPRYGYYEEPAYGYYGGGYAGPPAYQYAPPAYHSRPEGSRPRRVPGRLRLPWRWRRWYGRWADCTAMYRRPTRRPTLWRTCWDSAPGCSPDWCSSWDTCCWLSVLPGARESQ